jgi:phosphate butyryltransferase
VAVAVAQDEHVLEACVKASEMGVASFILVGNLAKINEIAKSHNFDLSKFELLNEEDEAKASAVAVGLVRDGKANALMKGLVDTSIIMKAVLDKENGIRTGSKLSHVAAFEISTYHKLLFITDAAINVDPDLTAKKEIIQNAANALNNLGIANPKVALLAAKEKVDPKMPVTEEYAKLVEMSKNGEITGCIVDGPLALDNAVSAESAKIKNIQSPVAANADILFCPDIEAGNILYKSLAFLTDAKNGGVVLGAKRPIILTSRADSSESKLISILLGVLF